jgi:hypothetical protein
MGTQLARFAQVGDSPLADDLIGSDANNILARKYALAAGQNILRGTVMGIDGSGDVLKSLSAAGDGSQTPFGIAAEDAHNDEDSPPTVVEVNVYVRGSFNEHALILGTAHTIASIREGLRDKGIYLETPVKRYP